MTYCFLIYYIICCNTIDKIHLNYRIKTRDGKHFEGTLSNEKKGKSKTKTKHINKYVLEHI